MCVCVCVCVCERERERERESGWVGGWVCMCVLHLQGFFSCGMGFTYKREVTSLFGEGVPIHLGGGGVGSHT